MIEWKLLDTDLDRPYGIYRLANKIDIICSKFVFEKYCALFLFSSINQNIYDDSNLNILLDFTDWIKSEKFALNLAQRLN